MKQLLPLEGKRSMAPLSARRARHLACVGAALAAAVLPVASAAPASATTREAHVSYIQRDGWGNIKYDVRFNGTVRSDGPTRYVIQGELDAYCHDSTITGQSITLGYGPSKNGWQYKSYWCTDAPVKINIEGNRSSGDSVDLIVGATSGVFNSYNYGSKQTFDIGTD
ncbi:hypothetical protein [Streptomyces sp. NPDC058145]|uniref:hypothetical protein n=1 Tax=Streptomyces sp. NPDC058145 TaxID=3346356 RepID=UPI0036E2A405